jgi:hypothetical protein
MLAAVTKAKTRDTGASARENVDFQNTYFKEHGGGVVLVFVDNLVSQDGEARATYQDGADVDVFLGTALIGGSALSRAMGSIFLGIARPTIPFRFFSTLDKALPWARQIRDKRAN